MGQLGGGCRVIGVNDGKLYQEGTRTRRRTIGSTINARDIEQSVSHFDQGLSPGQVNPTSEEVHFTVAGSGACYINGHRYELEAGSAAYVPPEAECCLTHRTVTWKSSAFVVPKSLTPCLICHPVQHPLIYKV